LLDEDAAAQPLASGTYVRDGDPNDRYLVDLQADGWYRVEHYNPNGSIGETHLALFNVIDPVGGQAAYAVAVQTDDGFVYASLLMGAAGRVYLATPDCGDPADRDLAVDQGARPGDDDAMTRNCIFHNRDALLSALTAFAGQADFGRPYHRH
jgi:hypothetical protein